MIECNEKTALPQKLQDLSDKIYKDELIFYRQKNGYDPISNSDDAYKVRNDAIYKFMETIEWKKYNESMQPILKEYREKFIATPRVDFYDEMMPEEFSKKKFDTEEEYRNEFYKGLTTEQIKRHKEAVKEQKKIWEEYLEEVRLRNAK
jgi:hypothetical protein